MTKEELKDRLLNTNFFLDNEYLSKYIDLIYNNRLEKHIKRFSQRHHGFPKNVSKKLGESIDDSKENLFEIKFSDHILAHVYLSLCSSDEDIKRANIVAYKWMLGKSNIDNIDDLAIELNNLQKIYEDDLSLCGKNHPMYGVSRPDLSLRNKTNPPHLLGPRNGMFGKKGILSPSFGKKHSKESREKMSKNWDYSKHITDSFIEKQISINKINAENKSGWYSADSRLKAKETRLKRDNYKLSEETKQKISDAKSKHILCINNNIEYKNALDVQNKTGLDRKLVSKCCKGEIEFVKFFKKRNKPIDYVYDDTKYVFVYVNAGDNI